MSETPDQAPRLAVGPGEILGAPDVGRRVVRGSATRLAGFVVINMLGVVGVIVLQRTLGVDDYGRYGTVLALIAVVALFTDAGLTITGSRELALRPHGQDRRRMLGTLLGVRLALTTVGMVGCVVFAVAAGYVPAMIGGLALAAIGSVLLAAQSALSLPLAVDLRNVPLTFTELAKQVVLLVGIALVALAGAGLVPFLAVQVAVGAFALAFTIALLDRGDRTWPHFELPDWLDLVRRALPVAAASVLAMAYVRMLVILASLLTDERETGLVVASARVVEIAGGLPLLLAGVVLPVVTVAARDDRVRLRYIAGRSTEVALLLGALVAVTLALAAHPFVITLGGSEFAGAAPVLRIHAIAVATFFVIQAWVTVLIADGHQAAVVRSSAIGLLAVLVAGAVLIPLYGAEGAAAAAVIADVANAVALAIALRGVTHRVWPTSLSFLVRLATVVVAAVAVGVLLPGPDLIGACVGAAILGAGALAMRLVPSEVTDALPRWARTLRR